MKTLIQRVGSAFSAVAVALACGTADEQARERTRQTHAALSSSDRILTYEGSIGTGSGADWRPGDGTTVAVSTISFEGDQALSLSGSQNPSAISAPLSTLGPIASNASIYARIPASLSGQSWLGQVALFINAPSAGLYNAYAGPTPLAGPVGEFRRYEIPLPPSVVSTLSAASYTDLSVTVQLNVPTDAAFLVDKLSFGQLSGGSGGAGGGGGTSSGGSGGANTSGGASGTAGSSGSAAASGAAGASSGASDGEVVRFGFKLPSGVSAAEIAMGTTGGPIAIDDSADLLGPNGGLASISSLESGAAVTRIGVTADVKNVWSDGPVFVASRGVVHGFAKSAQTVTLQDGTSQVLGGITQNADLGVLEEEAWDITFPLVTQGDVTLEPNTERTLASGAWGALSVKQGARLRIFPGQHTFTTITIEPGASLEITNFAPVYVYSRDGFTFRGAVQRSQATPNILFGIGGSNPVVIDSSFRGILVAPEATVSLATTTQGHWGSVFAQQIIQHQSTNFFHEPFDRAQLCFPDVACTPLCPCKDYGTRCSSDSECKDGLVCWLENGRRYDLPSGTGACADPRCITNPASLGCGDAASPCGRCDNAPRSGAEGCVPGDVLGTGIGSRFLPDAQTIVSRPVSFDACWSVACQESPNTPPFCGTADAPCGICDCSASCASKTCGDEPRNDCGGLCPALCDVGEVGCKTDFDCPSGAVCGIGVGPRFGFADGTNVCWNAACSDQDPAAPNCGVPPGIDCGQCPSCTPQCSGNSSGPDGCGGVCAGCGGNQIRALDLLCINPTPSLTEGGQDFPIPLVPPGPTDQLGAIPAAFRVGDSGSASYSIELEVPPGRAGLQPSLSLEYSSTKSNGMLGMSWRLGGLSEIRRCARIAAHDLQAQPVAYNQDDDFCMDGRRLVVVSANGDRTEYRTEVDSFARIVAEGPDFLNGVYVGPRRFRVFTKAGRVMTYGATDDSSVFANSLVKRIWALSTVSDLSSNSMAIRYRQQYAPGTFEEVRTAGTLGQIRFIDSGPTAEILPDVISWGAAPARLAGVPQVPQGRLDATRFVKFSYEPRPDPRRHYTAGVLGYSLQRMTRIDTYVQDALVKSYRISYHAGESLVSSVSECAREGGTEICKAPGTRFEYVNERGFEPSNPVLSVPTEGVHVPDLDCDCCGPGCLQPCNCIRTPDFIAQKDVIILDADGDGRDDVLGYSYVPGLPAFNNYWNLALSRHPLGFQGLVSSSRDGTPSIVEGRAPQSECLTAQSVVDINRDGKDDLVDLCPGGEASPGLREAHAYVSNGSSFRRQALGFAFEGRALLADFDGDGLRDIITCNDGDLDGTDTSYKPARQHRVAYMSRGDGVFLLVRATDGPGPCAGLTPLDFDGDGAEELVQTRDPNGRIRLLDFGGATEWVDIGASPTRAYRLIDINGDGLKDILIAPPPTPNPFRIGDDIPFELRINTGLGFVTSTAVVQTGGQVEFLDIAGEFGDAQVIDYDGDGREDLLTRAAVYHGVTPHRLIRAQLNFGSTAGRLGDVNGDGSADLITMGGDGSVTYRLNRDSARNFLLREVTDGHGKQIVIEYDAGQVVGGPGGGVPGWVPTYSGTTCQRDSSGFVTTCLRRVAPLVSAHFEQQVSGDQTKAEAGYRYHYFDARMGAGGRGWFGFGRRTVGHGLWTATLSYRNDDHLFAGKLALFERRFENPVPVSPFTTAVGSRIERSIYDWAAHSGQYTSFPLVDEEEHAVFEGSGTTPVTATAIAREGVDEFGNVTSSTVRAFTGGALVTTTTTTLPDIENRVDEDTWILGLARSMVTTSTRGNESLQRRMRFDYDSVGRVTLVEREPLAPTSSEYQKSTLEYDFYGNVTRSCVADSSGDSNRRCTEVLEFDPQHIFPRRVRNAAQLVATIDSSPRTGKPLVIRDPNGLLSQFAYDAFGRLRTVLTPSSFGTFQYLLAVPGPTGFPGFTRWAAHAVRSDFTGEGASTHTFDAFDRLVGESTPGFGGETVRVEHEYDALGRATRTTLPHLPSVTSQGFVRFEYDGFGRLSREVHPDDSDLEYHYPTRFTDVKGFVVDVGAASGIVVVKPRGNVEAVVHDPYGNPLRAVEASSTAATDSIVTSYAYGAFDMLKAVSAPVGVTTIVPDRLGRTVELRDPALGTQVYTYTGFDEVKTRTDAEGRLTSHEHDSLGRLRELRNGQGALLARWIYDGTGPNELGQLVAEYRQAKPDAATGNWTRYHYGPRGLPESIQYGLGGTPTDANSGQHLTIGFEYKPEVPWQLDVLHYPSAAGQPFAVQYDYDASGMLSAVRPAGNTDPSAAYWRMLEADQGFRLRRERFANGLVTTRSYYDTGCGLAEGLSCMPGRLATIRTERENASDFPVQNLRFAYDRNGNLAQQKLNDFSPLTEVYTYDGFDRLRFHDQTNPVGSSRLATYTYDAIGNITSKTGVGAYTYDPVKRFQVASAGSVSYHYDANGNQIERIDSTSNPAIPLGYQKLDYNDFDMPWRITNGQGSSALPVELEYTAAGARLVKRQLRGEGSSEASRVTVDIAELYQQISDFTIAGSQAPSQITHQYRIYAGGRQIAELHKIERGGALVPGETATHYLHDDVLGSTTAITDASGDLAADRDFTPFGEELSPINWNTPSILSGFTGHQHDPELGLVNMRGRLYDARLGRFTTPDPFVTEPLRAQGLNRYAYVHNNPLTFVDPSGFQCSSSGTTYESDGSVRNTWTFSGACPGPSSDPQSYGVTPAQHDRSAGWGTGRDVTQQTAPPIPQYTPGTGQSFGDESGFDQGGSGLGNRPPPRRGPGRGQRGGVLPGQGPGAGASLRPISRPIRLTGPGRERLPTGDAVLQGGVQWLTEQGGRPPSRNPVGDRLERIALESARDFEPGWLSRAERNALMWPYFFNRREYGRLYKMFAGHAIEREIQARAAADPITRGVRFIGNGRGGPDFRDGPGSNVYYEVTTIQGLSSHIGRPGIRPDGGSVRLILYWGVEPP